MSRPLLLDLFCCEGGAAAGYHAAGFDVVGVDIVPRRRYPFEFVVADALRPPFDLDAFDAIHASPPCQSHSATTNYLGDRGHPDLIPETREMLEATSVPFVIENVPGAATLNANIMLCGSMFGLKVRRHRYFETRGVPFALLPPCQHAADDLAYARPNNHLDEPRSESAYRDAMGCGWMAARTARQAIPPAYTEHLGQLLLEAIS